ncbi:bifunctional phosphopantothenoylcysteine decarboxylase/phosphopantothenate--cysteine ligase CoaBC [Pseudoclavibacter terrae]
MSETAGAHPADHETDASDGQPMRVVVGVTGGIAAYKAVQVIRDLVLLGHHVDVVPTESALRFVGRPTFEAISRNPVLTDVFDDVAEVRHVALGQQADVIAVVPATANSMAKIAAGLSDDLLGTTILASTAPLIVAPAMHTEMWLNQATQANAARLDARGVVLVGPAEGQLTGSDSGPGRLAEPSEIVATILSAGRGERRRRRDAELASDLRGRRVLITAGGTREPLDPVRFIGNRSSGRQGFALAERALARGAEVTLVAANAEVRPPEGVKLVTVSSAQQLAQACAEIAPRHDVIIMAAAVADYRPVTVAEGKIKKEQAGEELTLTFTRNPDILQDLSAARGSEQVIIGFAAETETDDSALLELGRAKIARKGCDYLVVNRVGWNLGFQSDENSIFVLSASGDVVSRHTGDKVSVADVILDLLVNV